MRFPLRCFFEIDSWAHGNLQVIRHGTVSCLQFHALLFSSILNRWAILPLLELKYFFSPHFREKVLSSKKSRENILFTAFYLICFYSAWADWNDFFCWFCIGKCGLISNSLFKYLMSTRSSSIHFMHTHTPIFTLHLFHRIWLKSVGIVRNRVFRH